MKSRNLSFNPEKSLKPTKSYIRESIFNIIKIQNTMSCLDLFSGSGILSAEFLSRGPQKAVLVENNPKTCQKINSEFKNLKIKNYDLLCLKVLAFIKYHKNK